MPASPNPVVTDADPLGRVLAVLRQRAYRFTTITPASHARVNARPGNAVARTLDDALGWSRPFPTGLLPAELFDALHDAGHLQPDSASPDLWRSDLRVSTRGDTLFLHSAFPTTSADSVFFGPDSYKFADAVEAFLSHSAAPVRRAVEICCGAGPGALTIARLRPTADIVMADINQAALRCAAANAAAAGAIHARTARSDLLKSVDGNFDLIVAHPPYLVDRGSRLYRHGGGPLGAGLSLDIVRASLDRLNQGGTLLLFTGVAIVDADDAFRQAAAAIIETAGFDFDYREVDPDVFGEELDHAPYDVVDRIALVTLRATRLA